MFCEMQKKTFLLESLRVRLSEVSLQPPSDILQKDDVSHFHGAVYGSVGTLGHLLSAPELLNFVLPPDSSALLPPTSRGKDSPRHGAVAAPQPAKSPGDAAVDQLRMHLMQCASPLACLDQMKFSLDGTIYDPVELIVRDNRCVLGFGYLGCTTSPICGGRGPLFNTLVKQASSSWSNLTPEQRSVMASDTAAMEALVSSLTSGVARVSSSATGGQPDWVPQVLSWQLYRDAITLQEVSPTVYRNPSQFSDFCWARAWMEGTLSQYRMAPNSPFFKKEFFVELPESTGNAKFWPHVMRLMIYEDTKISDAQVALRNQMTPTVYTIRDNSGGGPSGGMVNIGGGGGASTPVASASAGQHLIAVGTSGRLRGGNASLMPRVLGVVTASASSTVGEMFRFTGSIQPSADVDMLAASCTEGVRALFSAGALRQAAGGFDNLLPGGGGDDGGSMVEGGAAHGPRPGQRNAGNQRTLPLLWIRPSEDSFGLARVRRFQSLSMWIQQMMNDTDPVSQLEAVEAVGACGDSAHALAALRMFIKRPRVHPYIRGMTAAVLSRLSRKDFATSAEARKFLIEELLENMKYPAGSLTAVAKEAAKESTKGKDPSGTSQQLLALFASQFGPGNGQEWMPPLYSSQCMQFLQYVYHAISRIRDQNEETPEEVYGLIRDCLESLPSPVDLQVDLSNFRRSESTDCLELTPLSCDHTLSIGHFICSVVYEVCNMSISTLR